MREGMFYNAINIATESNWKKLQNSKARFGSWEASWNFIGIEEKNKTNPETEWHRLKKSGVRLILSNDKEFPMLLKEIPWPPFGIYIKGELPKNGISIAVVGTRKATNEGKNAAKKFAYELAAKKVSIISGLALGIDAAAHVGCLDAAGITIAVLANGLDSVYPKTHYSLAKKILENGGALVSEYPLEGPPFPSRFIERNRIVSGLSRGTLVVEAPERSGSLATARFAMEQNRDVFVIPGPISHSNFSGSNQLIRNGAELVTKPEEILQVLGIETANSTKSRKTFGSKEEKLVFMALKDISCPADVDTLIEITNLGIAEVNTALSFLIIKTIVKETEDGYTLTN